MGTLVGAVVPALVLLGLVHLDDKGVAALVVAVNALAGFGVRFVVTPTAPGQQVVVAPAGSAR